jgi:hypothetical protein
LLADGYGKLESGSMEMSNDHCKHCEGRLVEIDHWGERLRGCPKCNRWQDATGGWCRLTADDAVALRVLREVAGDRMGKQPQAEASDGALDRVLLRLRIKSKNVFPQEQPLFI